LIYFYGIIIFLGLTLLLDAILTSQYRKRKRDRARAITPSVRNSLYHHELKPNWSTPQRVLGPYVYSHYTNSLGFRDQCVREVSLQTSSSRLVILGDSYVEGLGVNYEDTFVGQVAKALPHIEVLNAGVSIYSPSIFYRKMKFLFEEKKLQLDILAVFIDISNVQDEYVRSFDFNENIIVDADRLKQNPTILPKKFFTFSTLLLKSEKWLKQTFIPDSVYKRHIDFKRSNWTINKDFFQEYGVEGLEKCKANMNKLLTLARENGVKKVILAVFPWPTQIYYKDLDSMQVKIWQEWASKNNVTFINLFPDYIAPNKNPMEILKKYFLPWDIHWNQAGHKLVATRFLQVIKDLKN